MWLTQMLALITVQMFSPTLTKYLEFNNTCNTFGHPTYEERIYNDVFLSNGTPEHQPLWDEKLDYLFMSELSSSPRAPGACDYDQLLLCTTVTQNQNCTGNCSVCLCSQHFAVPGNVTIVGANPISKSINCKALVGHPCQYRNEDSDGKQVLLKANYDCTDGATCEQLYGVGEETLRNRNITVQRIAEKSGVIFDRPLGELIIPIHRYIIQNVEAVCVCKPPFRRYGVGFCTNQTISRGGLTIMNHLAKSQSQFIILFVYNMLLVCCMY